MSASRRLRALRLGLAALTVLALTLAVAPRAAALDLASPLPELAAAVLGGETGTASVARWRDGQLETAHWRRLSGAVADAQGRRPAGPLPPGEPAPLFEIGSISKVFTGLLLAQAEERGELSLDQRLGELLREAPLPGAAPVAAIRLRELVTHTACLPRQFGRVGAAAAATQIVQTDRAALRAALAAQELPRAAPCEALYSNYGLAVLGEVLVQRLGQPWDALVRERITAPLGLTDTDLPTAAQAARLAPGFAGEAVAAPWPMSAYAPAGGLRATAADLALFGRALLQGRQGPLGAAAERVREPLAAMDGAAIGHALFVLGPPQRPTWMHDGLTGGYRALLVIAPDSGVVFAALVSNRFAPLPRVGSELLRARYPVPAPAAAGAADLPLTDYVGTYGGGPEGRRFEVAQADGRLHLRSSQGVYQAYVAAARDRFVRPAGGALLEFERDAQGRVQGLALSQAGRRFVVRRDAQGGAPAPVLAPGAAAAYVGLYQVPRIGRAPVEFRVAEEAGQLIVRSSSVDWQAVVPLPDAPDRFRYDVPAWLQFERDADGRVQALVLHENGGTLRARRPGAVAPAATTGRD